MDFKPGDHFTVKVGDWEYDTVIDDRGVQRFVANEAVSLMVDGSTRDYSRPFAYSPSVTLNEIGVAFYEGKIPMKDMIDFHTAMGYSVGGFADLSYWDGIEIINPLWEG